MASTKNKRISPLLNDESVHLRRRKNIVIAIDGPAGTGKSTVARIVASRLGFLYVDTGAMYRAFTLKAIKSKIDFTNEEALNQLTKNTQIDLKMSEDRLKVLLDGEYITQAIRDQDLTQKVSYIAKLGSVRTWMVKLQRSLCRGKGAVLEGRDIGTVVFPGADKKFYLDAEFEERVRRRHKELCEMGQKVPKNVIEEDVKIRDRSDKTRKIAPLVQAPDAIYVDTTKLTIEEVVKKIIKEIV